MRLHLDRDNRRGVLNLAVSLTDTASPGKASLYLGQQPVVTSQPGNFTDRFRIDGSPTVNEVLRFEFLRARRFASSMRSRSCSCRSDEYRCRPKDCRSGF